MDKKKNMGRLTFAFAVLSIIILQYVTIPLMLIFVDALFGITWSMGPVYLAGILLFAASVSIALFVRGRMTPNIQKVIWFSLSLLVVSFSCAVIWAGAISNIPGY